MAQIREIMTQNPKTCGPQDSVVDVAKLMASEDVGPIPVVEGDKLVGIVTDRDIVVRVVAEGRYAQSTTLGEIASSDVATVSPDDDLDRALELMGSKQIRRLPVVQGQRLVGIVAQADIARHADETKVGDVVEDISR
jgi:CBS domain-containing protein